MSILFEIRKSQAPASCPPKRRAPNGQERDFLKALAGGERRPKGCGSASYFCLMHGWAEPLLINGKGTVIAAREIAAGDRFKKNQLRWKSAGYALTEKGAALIGADSPDQSVQDHDSAAALRTPAASSGPRPGLLAAAPPA